MDTTITPNENTQSRFNDTADATTTAGLKQTISIARVQAEAAYSRAWRVTLGRVERVDGHGLNNGVFPSIPAWIAQDFSYAAGILGVPQVPPRRSNPVWGLNTPGSNNVLPLFAQIAWGVAGGQQRHRLLANWPMMGASLVVYGTSVEVWGGAFVSLNQDMDSGTAPRFSASIVPVEGPAPHDGAELSLTQNVIVTDLAAPAPALAGIITDGVANPTRGFATPVPGTGALPISAVLGVGPFSGWAARISSLSTNPTQPRLVMDITANPARAAQFELRDNQIPDGAGGWLASPGNVGVAYALDHGAGATHTVAELETLISTSTLLFVVTPSPNQAFVLNTAWTTLPPPGPPPAYSPQVSGVAIAQAVGATQGGQVYVPDFARRLCVQIAKPNDAFVGQDPRVPLTGTLPTQIVWYDDQGQVVFTEFQATLAAQSTVWRPVPAAAVMVGIYGPTVVQPDVAQLHWRIAP